MNKDFIKLRDDAGNARLEYEKASARLTSAVRNCVHQWGKVEAAHIYTPGYTIPGDPPGTMGVDWRGPVDVPSKTEYRWKRVCSICGEIQYTSSTEDEVIKHPKFYER